MNKYLKQYKWANIRAMRKNSKKTPKICLEDFRNKRVVITGATSGIGYQTALKYASHGANLLCINRNLDKSQKMCKEIQQKYHVDCHFKIADFTVLDQVRAIAQELATKDYHIDVLINNAGIFQTRKQFTEDNIEQVFQVNYLASFLLTYMLKDKFLSQNSGRILFVNSEGHRFAIFGIHLNDLEWKKHRYSGMRSYGVAKTAQLLSILKFHEIFQGSGVTVNAIHPGDVKSNMGENNGWLYRFWKHMVINPSLKSPERSAEALYYLGVSPELNGTSGKFFNLTTEEEPAPPALDREVAEELWELSLKMIGEN